MSILLSPLMSPTIGDVAGRLLTVPEVIVDPGMSFAKYLFNFIFIEKLPVGNAELGSSMIKLSLNEFDMLSKASIIPFTLFTSFCSASSIKTLYTTCLWVGSAPISPRFIMIAKIVSRGVGVRVGVGAHRFCEQLKKFHVVSPLGHDSFPAWHLDPFHPQSPPPVIQAEQLVKDEQPVGVWVGSGIGAVSDWQIQSFSLERLRGFCPQDDPTAQKSPYLLKQSLSAVALLLQKREGIGVGIGVRTRFMQHCVPTPQSWGRLSEFQPAPRGKQEFTVLH